MPSQRRYMIMSNRKDVRYKVTTKFLKSYQGERKDVGPAFDMTGYELDDSKTVQLENHRIRFFYNKALNQMVSEYSERI